MINIEYHIKRYYKCWNKQILHKYIKFVKHHNINIIRSIIEYESIEYQDPFHQMNALMCYLSIANNIDIDIIRILANETTINQIDRNHKNVLMYYINYAKKHDINIIRLLSTEKSIMQLNYSKNTPLDIYCRKNINHDIEIINFLSNDMSINNKDNYNYTALIHYCKQTQIAINPKIVKLLANSTNIDTCTTDLFKFNALSAYCLMHTKCNIDIINILSTEKTNNHMQNNFNALMSYCIKNREKNKQIIELLSRGVHDDIIQKAFSYL